MVSAGQVSTNLSDLTSYFSNYSSLIDGLSSSWMGLSYDNVKTKSSVFMDEYYPVVNSQMNSFMEAVNLYQQYVEAKNAYLTAQSKYNTAVSNKDSSAMTSYGSTSSL